MVWAQLSRASYLPKHKTTRGFMAIMQALGGSGLKAKVKSSMELYNIDISIL